MNYAKAVLHQFGGPDVIQVETNHPIPEPLSEAAEAHRLLESGLVTGHLVLTMCVTD